MKPWLLLNPKLAHDLAPLGLHAMALCRRPRVYRWRKWPELSWQGLTFQNRLGIAGGVDKDGDRARDWWKFGPGFIEIGTVTPRPQGPNEGRIIDRDSPSRAVWNRMGFPGKGAIAVRENLRGLERDRLTPLFINIGKNRSTPNEDAARDYCECVEKLAFAADAFVINISSPNTRGLRDLFRAESFRPFLGAIIESRNRHRSADRRLPLLLKLSPDLEREDLERVVRMSRELGVSGWIATNTTLARETNSPFPTEGGVSGLPLAARSKAVLKDLLGILGSRSSEELVISAGGVMTPEDVGERLQLGADLVQVYAALVYEGPGFFRRVANYMNQS